MLGGWLALQKLVRSGLFWSLPYIPLLAVCFYHFYILHNKPVNVSSVSLSSGGCSSRLSNLRWELWEPPNFIDSCSEVQTAWACDWSLKWRYLVRLSP